MSLATLACVAAGSWIILGALIAPRIGRMLSRLDDEHDKATHPPLPPVLRVVSDDDYAADQDDATWLSAWPSADEAEQAVYDALFAAMPEVAADLRDHA